MTALRAPALDVSIVIPLYNEEDNVGPAIVEVLDVLNGMTQTAELILVDDGSRDKTYETALAWHEKDPRVKVIRFRRNFGQTAAIAAGFEHATGRVVVLMDGDQQNDPRDIPALLAKVDEGYDVVSGWRKERKDKLIMRRIPSMLANRLISKVTKTRLHDYGCTLKAYHIDVVRDLRLYGELHRFIPALATLSGADVAEIPVNHRARTRGSSKYGISRTIRVVLDLLTVNFLLRYRSRPMQFFGLPGLASMIVGSLILAGLFVQRVAFQQGIAERPLLIGGVLLTILGVQFLCMGFLGEMTTRVYHEVGNTRPYVIRTTAGLTEGTAALQVVGTPVPAGAPAEAPAPAVAFGAANGTNGRAASS